MRRLFMLVFMLAYGKTAFAQHYQCFQHDSAIHWYTNNGHYLRAIRIDSILTSGTDTVYYPYTSQTDNSTSIATASPGWVGSNVHELPDGTFLFNNNYGDTVVIKTQAALGESWVFYNDTTSRYYKATVISTDTMTIVGNVDSIKKIKVQTYSPALEPDDYFNSYSIILSKAHGLVQVFDLYHFPYRSAAATYPDYHDAYFDIIGTSAQAMHFTVSNFHVPNHLEIYDQHPGDVLEYYRSRGCNCNMGMSFHTNDSVLYRNDPDPYHATIAVQSKRYGGAYYCTDPDPTSHFSYQTYIDTIRLDTTALFSFSFLPEAYGQTSSYFYNSNDTSDCITSPTISWRRTSIFEGCYPSSSYKYGVGVVDTGACTYCFSSSEWTFDTEMLMLSYNKKDGASCGISYPMAVDNELAHNQHITVAPNPASNQITVSMSGNYGICHYTLVNMQGQTIRRGYIENALDQINVQDLPEGLYLISISLGANSTLTEKVAIIHGN